MVQFDIASSQSEAGFQALFRFATVGILVVRKDGTIELANPFIEKHFGYSREEIIGKPVEILIPPTMRNEHVEHREKYFQNPKARHMGLGLNLFGLKKDGTKFPIEISLGHYRLENQRYAVAFITDITERLEAEKHALEKEREYRLIFEGIHESFMLQEIVYGDAGEILDLVFLDVNPATEEILGKDREDIIGHKRSEFFGPLDPNLAEVIRTVESTGERVKYEQSMESVGRWFNRTLYRHKPGQVITLSVDITEQKLHEQALRENQAMLEREAQALSFLNECGVRLWLINDLEQGLKEIVDASLQVTGADKGTVQLFDKERQVLFIAAHAGFDQEFLEYFREVSAGDDSACGKALKYRKQVIVDDTETDKLFSNHRDIARRSGFRAVQSTPLFDEKGEPIGIISTHFEHPSMLSSQVLYLIELYARGAEGFLMRCSVLKALEREKSSLEKKVMERTRELTAALERERELSQLKSSFVAMASHEFRTPLSTIVSSTALIDQYKREDQESNRKKHTARIKAAAKNLIDILDEFLSVEKLEQGKVGQTKQWFNLRQFASDIVMELSAILKPGQSILFDYEGLTDFEQDKKILKNVLINLLSNAIKYSDEGQDIYLTIEANNHQVSIAVKDEGIGIPEEEQKNLFDIFFRAKNAAGIQGTGLGLSIVKRYIELLGGSIDFVSRQHEGTTFTVRLPVDHPDHHSRA